MFGMGVFELAIVALLVLGVLVMLSLALRR